VVRPLDRVSDGALEQLHADVALGQVVVGASLEGGGVGVVLPLAREQDDRDGAPGLARPRQKLQAVACAEAVVEEAHVHAVPRKGR